MVGFSYSFVATIDVGCWLASLSFSHVELLVAASVKKKKKKAKKLVDLTPESQPGAASIVQNALVTEKAWVSW